METFNWISHNILKLSPVKGRGSVTQQELETENCSDQTASLGQVSSKKNPCLDEFMLVQGQNKQQKFTFRGVKANCKWLNTVESQEQPLTV